MKSILLYLGHEHECAYFPDRMARFAYVDPDHIMTTTLYSALAKQGFRRSGHLVYQPNCQACRSCVPVRIPVTCFQPNRCQTRILRNHRDLTVIPQLPVFNEEHYRLYCNYLNARHGDGAMASSSREQYIAALASDWSSTTFYEFRLKTRLLAVAVVDRLAEGLSAVYTFFDPELPKRSLGNYAVLWQIEETRRLKLSWLYLGFWIENCRKMAYKSQYRPLEALFEGCWWRFEKGEKIEG